MVQVNKVAASPRLCEGGFLRTLAEPSKLKAKWKPGLSLALSTREAIFPCLQWKTNASTCLLVRHALKSFPAVWIGMTSYWLEGPC